MSTLYSEYVYLKLSRGALKLIKHLLFKYKNDTSLKTKHLCDLLEISRQIDLIQRSEYRQIDFPAKSNLANLVNMKVKYLKK